MNNEESQDGFNKSSSLSDQELINLSEFTALLAQYRRIVYEHYYLDIDQLKS